jgi:hypothetical protein
MGEFKEYGTHRYWGRGIPSLLETNDEGTRGKLLLETHLKHGTDDTPVNIAIFLELFVHLHGELHFSSKNRKVY